MTACEPAALDVHARLRSLSPSSYFTLSALLPPFLSRPSPRHCPLRRAGLPSVPPAAVDGKRHQSGQRQSDAKSSVQVLMIRESVCPVIDNVRCLQILLFCCNYPKASGIGPGVLSNTFLSLAFTDDFSAHPHIPKFRCWPGITLLR